MASGTTVLAVAAGLAAGIALIAIFALMQLPDKSPQLGLHMTESGQVLLIDTSYVVLTEGANSRFNDRNQLAVDIMLSNDTVVELLEGRNVEVGAVGHFACASGASCALVILHHKEDLNKSAHITVDYSSQKVIRIQHTDGW